MLLPPLLQDSVSPHDTLRPASPLTLNPPPPIPLPTPLPLLHAALVDYITSGPVVAICLEGKDVVAQARKIIGATNPLAADPGSIRGQYCIDIGRNIIHG